MSDEELPDQALYVLRLRVLRLAHDADGGVIDRDNAARVAELFSALDNHLSDGGPLPRDWRRSRE